MTRRQLGAVVLMALGVAAFAVGWLPQTCSLGGPPPYNTTTVGATCTRPGAPVIVFPLWTAAVALFVVGVALYPRTETR